MLLQISFWVMKFPTWNSYRQTLEDFPWLTGKEIRNLLRLSFSLEAEEVASAFPSQLLCVKYRNHSTWLMRLNSSFVRFKTWFSAFISRFGLPEKTKSQSTVLKTFFKNSKEFIKNSKTIFTCFGISHVQFWDR